MCVVDLDSFVLRFLPYRCNLKLTVYNDRKNVSLNFMDKDYGGVCIFCMPNPLTPLPTLRVVCLTL